MGCESNKKIHKLFSCLKTNLKTSIYVKIRQMKTKNRAKTEQIFERYGKSKYRFRYKVTT